MEWLKALSTPFLFKEVEKSRRNKSQMNKKEPSQDIDDILIDEESADFDADDIDNDLFDGQDLFDINTETTNGAVVDKNEIPDIISHRDMPYFPHPFDAPIIGIVENIYVETIDYIVGMKRFEELLEGLGVSSKSSDVIERTNSIYKVLHVDVMNMLGVLSDDDILNSSRYTVRVNSSLYTSVGFDECVLKHLQQYHVNDMLEDIGRNILHRFISLTYQKNNLIIHLFPKKCMELKNISYEEAMSYCVSVMWATLISIVYRSVDITDKNKQILEILSEVFFTLNPILTKFVTCSKRPLIPEGYSFMYELQQLKSAKEHFTMKVAPNHINYRWSPMSYRFEDYIEQFVRNRFPNADEEIADVRGDSNGKRCCIYDCRIDNGYLVTRVTVLGQNIVRDVTGYYTTQIYGFFCDTDYLKHLELAILFTFLTATKQHNNLFQGLLNKTLTDMKCGRLRNIGFFSDDESSTIDDYSAFVVILARMKLKKHIFKNLVSNKDYLLATQLIEKFNMKRNVPKDIITVHRILSLPEEKQGKAIIDNVERHKRDKIKRMVEYGRTVKAPKYILHRLYNYLLAEGFRL